MYFGTKSYLKSTRNHIAKHALREGARESENGLESLDQVVLSIIKRMVLKVKVKAGFVIGAERLYNIKKVVKHRGNFIIFFNDKQ